MDPASQAGSLAAGTGGVGGAEGVAEQTISEPCLAQGIVRARCLECHGASLLFGATIRLDTFDAFQQPSPQFPEKRIFETAKLRIHDTERPMPPMGLLPERDLALLDSWLASGAPADDCPERYSGPGG